MAPFYTSEYISKSAAMREELEDDFATNEDVEEDDEEEKETEADFTEVE